MVFWERRVVDPVSEYTHWGTHFVPEEKEITHLSHRVILVTLCKA